MIGAVWGRVRFGLVLGLMGVVPAFGQTATVGIGPVITEPGNVGDHTELARQIEAMVAEPAVRRAHWGVVVEAMDGTPIYSLNGDQFFQPASNTKLFTTATAMALLGGERRFETRIEARGRMSGGAASGGIARAGALPESGTTVGGEVLDGDLVLVGGGEANLSGRQVPYVRPADRPKPAPGAPPLPVGDPLAALAGMADAVVATGLREVHGDVVGDDTLYPWDPYPSDWSIDDATWYYGAPINALMINDNQVDVTVTPSAPGSKPVVTILPDVPAYFTVDTSGLTTGPAKSESHVGFDLPVGSHALRIYGTMSADAKPETEGIAIADPAEYGAMALKAMLEARGVHVNGKARAQHRIPMDALPFLKRVQSGATMAQMNGVAAAQANCGEMPPAAVSVRVLATHRSEPLVEDITVTNKVSQNQHAELLLLKAGAVFGCGNRPPESDRVRGASVIHDFLVGRVGIDPADFVFYDGSGLSGHDLVTPRATARLLTYASGQPWFPAWRSSLPVAGEDGSLQSRFPRAPLKDHVWAKTGTLGEARALSGYLQGASGQTVVFSVMVTDHAPSGHADQDAMDRIVAAVAAAN